MLVLDFWDCTSLLDASSSLRSNIELEDELEAGRTSSLGACSASLLNESCDSDVPDEPLSGLVDNPGTTRGTKLSVLQITLFPSLVNRGFWPLTHSREYPWSSQRLPSNRAAGVLSNCYTVTNRFRSRTLVPPRGFALLQLQSTPLLRFWTSSLCPSLLSFILFCSSCALMLLNHLQIRARRRRCRHYLCFNKGEKIVVLSDFLSL